MYGFHPGTQAIDMLAPLQIAAWKTREFGFSLHIFVIDVSRAFDSMDHERLLDACLSL